MNDTTSRFQDIDWYSVVASRSDGLIVCRGSGQIIRCSDGAADLLGCAPDDALERHISDLAGPCLRPDGRMVLADRPIWSGSDGATFVRGLTVGEDDLRWVRFDLHRQAGGEMRAGLPVDGEDAAAILLVLTRTSFPFEATEGEMRATATGGAGTSARGQARSHTIGNVGQAVGLYRSTPQQGLIAADEGMERLFGYSKDALRAIDAEDMLVNPSEAEALRRRRRENGGLHREEIHFRRSDGESFWGLFNSIPTHDDDGDVLFYDSIIIDITDLKEAQFALQASEELYRVLAEHSVDIITRHALDSTYHYVSPAVESVLGYTPEEMMGRRAIDITHPDDLGIYRQIARALDDEARIKERVRFRHRDGHYVWLEVTGRLVRDPSSDRGIEYVASSRDVTMQVESENVLRSTAQRLRIMSDISQATLQTTDLHTVGQVALDTLARAIPQCRSSILAFRKEQGYAEVLAVRADDEAGIDEGTRLPLDWLHTFDALQRGLDGRVTDLDELSSSSPLLHRLKEMGIQSFISVPAILEGQTVGALNLAHNEPDAFSSGDINMAREVARLIALAMRQKRYQDDLVEAKEEAEEMSRLKSAFLANMSHEIRTPLTAILGFADVLADESEAPHDEIARLISRSGHRLMDTLESVLQLSRLEAGNVELSPEPVDVAEEVREVVALMQARADEADVEIRVDLPPGEVAARLDSMALFRVLSNLVSNAIKFTERDGRVSVSLRASEDSLVVTVQDTGIGMAPSVIPELFGAFRQESTGTRRSHEGSGLGLTIVRRLVDLMNGTITVDSAKGQGSTFTLELPVEPDDAPEPDFDEA